MNMNYASASLAVAAALFCSSLHGALAAEDGIAPSNIVVNGSFETPLHYNGATLRQFSDANEAYLATDFAKSKRAWTLLDAQGWYAEGPDATGASLVSDTARTGTRCLRIVAGDAPRSVISSFEQQVDSGPVTLTAWVKTSAAKATLGLDLVSGYNQVRQKAATVRQTADLPADAGAWTQVTVTASSPSKLDALCRLSITSGTVWMDDVQIVASSTPPPFNVRPQEWVRLDVEDAAESDLPRRREGSDAPLRLTATNDSTSPLNGKVSIWLGPWNKPKQRLLAAFDGAAWKTGATRSVGIPIGTLPAGAYVASVSIAVAGRTLVDGSSDFFPLRLAGGAVSNGSVAARDVLRIIVAPKIASRDLFGVNDGGLFHGNGNWSVGYDPQDFLDGSELGIDCTRGHYSDDVGYMAAMSHMDWHVMFIDDAPGLDGFIDATPPAAAADAVNPAFPQYLDLSSPAGIALLKKRAQETGLYFSKRPGIASYQMANECPYLDGGRVCPSSSADADFRNWCRARYGTLDVANDHWNTHYTSWDQVEQIVSARFLEEVKAEPKLAGAAAIDWTASTGRFSPEVVKRMETNPGVAMDWLRWRTTVTLRSYELFRKIANEYAPDTLISTNLCWPDFRPEIAMPFYRAMDATMIDIQYTSGMPRSLGTPYEMMDALEMSETCAPGKPFWGCETYYEPQWPAEYMALQNWALLAHGMTNNLVYDWKPTSDVGPIKETHAWEKPDAPPIWCIIDTDGTKLPAYYTYKRSHDEIAAYNKKYDGLTVKRAPTSVAFYVSFDTTDYYTMQTGYKAWLSDWQRTRNNLIYLLRMNGVSVDYVDDATLPNAPGQFDRIIVPASYALSQESAEKLKHFAEAGGTVVLAGPSGVCDPWLNKYADLGGPAWSDLGWKAPDFADGFTAVSFVSGEAAKNTEFRGAGVPAPPGAQPIHDAAGNVAGWTRSWGRGQLVAYDIFPDTYTTDPHPSANLTAWTRQLIAAARLPISGVWLPASPEVTGGTPGNGSAVVEVVVREKSPDDQFVFCLNQGGAGDGTVAIPVSGPGWKAADVITGEEITQATLKNGQWSLPMHLGQFGYRVIHLYRVG